MPPFALYPLPAKGPEAASAAKSLYCNNDEKFDQSKRIPPHFEIVFRLASG